MNCVSGINKIYIAPFVCYKKRQFDYNEFSNTLTSMPAASFKEVFFYGKPSATSSASLSENGYFFEESISVNTSSIEEILQLNLLSNRVRLLLELNNGSYVVLGLMNGLKLNSKTTTTGSELNEFNQFVYSFSGKENQQLLSLEDLTGSGIEIVGKEFLLTESGFFLLQENGDKIIL